MGKEKYLINISTTDLANVNDTHNFTYRTNLLNLDINKEYEIGLLSFSIWYAWFNITEANNKVRYLVSGAPFIITLDNGNYGISDINSAIQAKLVENGHSSSGITLYGNYTTLRVDLTLEPNYDIDFSYPNSINNLLGFNNQLYENNTASDILYQGESAANITNSIDMITICIDVLDVKYNQTNNKTSNVIHSFIPTSGPGSNLSSVIPSPVFLKLNSSGPVNTMQISLRDQSQRLVDLNKENVSLSLLIKEV